MPLVRLAATPALPALAAPAAIARAVDGLLSAPHRVLARAAGTSMAPALTRRLPSPPRLLEIVRALTGRLVVDHPCAVVRLPWAVGALARAALQATLGPPHATEPDASASHQTASHETAGRERAAPNMAIDGRAAADARRLAALRTRLPQAAAALAPGARWAAAALYEPTALRVRLAAPGTEPPEPAPVPAEAWLTYRLAIVVGRDAIGRDAGPTADDWARADGAVDAAVAAADGAAWPPGPRAGAPWYARRLLVADAAAAALMDDATLARWAALTGRGGGDRRDRYWYRESWERFCEPGRQVGHVSPDHVARSRRSHRTRPPTPPAWGALAPAAALDPDAEQGVCVPPGYCLVDCVGTLEVSVVAV